MENIVYAMAALFTLLGLSTLYQFSKKKYPGLLGFTAMFFAFAGAAIYFVNL
ncbi:hypothetical protein Thimo_1863 [Thioflavicoccus mobilis 8321]|uniref:Uncharacterized protein n=1 Tax=Thioflavicoccus mobilis 8321 TaxID=765912 RepID=L0GXB9_9GAMM|nr:hypothetical protein [Thioflavicoccus mobilis]AGA90631.1 hypothetical protein Thimo_1863 [Thioflavicoccus mobilis 8321]